MCSTAILGAGNKKILAENYDFNLDHGLIAVNLQGTLKENGRQQGEKALRWRVKYGSITFNQFSLELPVSGMNEAGLAIALMWHHEGDAGSDDSYTRLGVLQWIQYQLDTARYIDEVIQSLHTVRPKKEGIPLHYSILDAQGDSLLVEFIAGEVKYYKNPDYPILTNSSYESSLEYASIGQTAYSPNPNDSKERFVRLFRHYSNLNHINYGALQGFACLDVVSQLPAKNDVFPWDKGVDNPTTTVWSIVFKPSEKIILLRTCRNSSIRVIDLSDVDFRASSIYRILDVHAGVSGSITNLFKPYASQENRRILQQTASAMNIPVTEQESIGTMVDLLYQEREIRLKD